MCRLLGFVAPTATTLEELIGVGQCVAFRDMSRLHADGWGSAWWDTDDGRPVLQRLRDTAPPASSSPLVDAMESDRAYARIVHLRMATAGLPVNIDNTHPFVADDLAFAHNGAIPIAPLRARLQPATAARVRGGTDSELYFALIRQRHAEGVPMLDATSEVVTDLRRHHPTASFNALLLTADDLIAVHVSENSLIPTKEFDESGLLREELPIEHLDLYYQMRYLRTAAGATVFASSGIAAAGWTPLPPACVASVSLDGSRFEVRELETAAAIVRE